MVVFDASILIDLFNQKLSGDKRIKLDYLLETLTKSKIKIIIPTPVLAEFMARANKAKEQYFQKISSSNQFRLSPFGTKAAMECSLMIEAARNNADKKGGSSTWAKAKFDWQIVSIAKSENASVIYSDDGDIHRISSRFNIEVIKTADLQLPLSALQGRLEFNPE
ncbi:MAG: type II toxin-antitoxin system VapC family toxin [Methylotenera sp.]|nr:type II toxin-antitoxin system VapC family toxin [Methylotenera sp.]